MQAFRDALEKSVTISRERLQEVVDDAVRRGRMTRGDAEELVSRLVTRGREQAESILGELEKLLAQVRDGAEAASDPAPDGPQGHAQGPAESRGCDRAGQAGGRRPGEAREEARRERCRSAAGPARIASSAGRGPRGCRSPRTTQLTIRQIDSRLAELTRAQLTKVRDYEQSHKARKGILRAHRPQAREVAPAATCRRATCACSSISFATSSSDSSELCARTASLPSSLRTSSVALSSVSLQVRDLILGLGRRPARGVAQPRRPRRRCSCARRRSPSPPAERRSSIAFWMLSVTPPPPPLPPLASTLASSLSFLAKCGPQPIRAISSAVRTPKSRDWPSVSSSSSSALSRWPCDHSSRSQAPASRFANQRGPNLLAQRPPPADLEGPGAQVAGDVEPSVDVREPGLRGPRAPRSARPAEPE